MKEFWGICEGLGIYGSYLKRPWQFSEACIIQLDYKYKFPFSSFLSLLATFALLHFSILEFYSNIKRPSALLTV